MNPPKVTQRFIEINATRNGHDSMARVTPASLKAARLLYTTPMYLRWQSRKRQGSAFMRLADRPKLRTNFLG